MQNLKKNYVADISFPAYDRQLISWAKIQNEPVVSACIFHFQLGQNALQQNILKRFLSCWSIFVLWPLYRNDQLCLKEQHHGHIVPKVCSFCGTSSFLNVSIVPIENDQLISHVSPPHSYNGPWFQAHPPKLMVPDLDPNPLGTHNVTWKVRRPEIHSFHSAGPHYWVLHPSPNSSLASGPVDHSLPRWIRLRMPQTKSLWKASSVERLGLKQTE